MMDSTVLPVKITRNAEEWGSKLQENVLSRLDNLKSCMYVFTETTNSDFADLMTEIKTVSRTANRALELAQQNKRNIFIIKKEIVELKKRKRSIEAENKESENR